MFPRATHNITVVKLRNKMYSFEMPSVRPLFFVCSVVFLLFTTSALSESQLWKWSEGTPAAGAAATLKSFEPVSVTVPAQVLDSAKSKRTAVFYFSPMCSHCQHVMDEINQLSSSFSEVS